MNPNVSHAPRFGPVAVVLIMATMAVAAIHAPTAEAQLPNSPLATYSVEGYVYNDRAEPLDAALVEIYSAGGGEPKSATTNSDGKYVLSGLAAGTYNATASAPNLLPSFIPIRVG